MSCLINLAGTVDGESRASYSLTTLLKADPATEEALHSFEFESNTRRGKPPPNRRLARFASATPADASHYAEATSKGLLRLSERPCSCRRRRAFSRGLPGSGASLPRLLGVRVLVNSSASLPHHSAQERGRRFPPHQRLPIIHRVFPGITATQPVRQSVCQAARLGGFPVRPQAIAIRTDLCTHH